MLKMIRRLSKSTAQPPGALIHIGETRLEEILITRMRYGGDGVVEETGISPQECRPDPGSHDVTWFNLDGIHDPDLLRTIGEAFGLHPLVLEDILNTTHLPKLEDLDGHLFVVGKMTTFDRRTGEISSEHLSLILGDNFVLSFQEKPGDIFDPVRERIRQGKGRIRKMGADYLLYALMDTMVDQYYVVLEAVGEEIESLETATVENPVPAMLQSIHRYKREISLLKRYVWPLREIVNTMLRGESSLIKKGTAIYLRDLYDHTIHVIETVETFRDAITGLQDIYLSSVSNKMNEVMKVLTIIATIFIPLTFIAGIYGMNFNPDASPFNMPELNWRYGYLFFWGLMGMAAIGLVIFFKKKKWL